MQKGSIYREGNLLFHHFFNIFKQQFMPKAKAKITLPHKKVTSLVQSMRQKQDPSLKKTIKKKEVQIQGQSSNNSSKSKSIASESSAFWPFTDSVENNNFLAHMVPPEQKSIPAQVKQTFTSDPTEKVFLRQKKQFGRQQFAMDQFVLAKCTQEPLWPCKVLQIEHIPGLVPQETVYHVKFINDNNNGIFDQSKMVKMSAQNVQELRSVTENKKLLKALKMAEKMNEKMKQQDQAIIDTQVEPYVEKKDEQKNAEAQQSIAEESLNSNVQISKQGFYRLKKNADKQESIQHSSSSQQKPNPQKQILKFQPIVLINGSNLEINLHGMKPIVQQQTEIKKTDRNSPKQKRIRLKKKDNETAKCVRKPLNLVVQTPKLNQKYFINKIVLKFSQLDQASKTDGSSQQLTNPNDETRMDEHMTSVVNIRATTKKIHIKKDNNVPKIQEVQKYLLEYIDDIDRVRQISCRQVKQKLILDYLSKPVNMLLIKQNYSIYNKIIKMCIEVIKKSQSQNSNEIFCLNLKFKLKMVNQILQNYRGSNKYVNFLQRVNKMKLETFLQEEDKKALQKKNNQDLILSLESEQSKVGKTPEKKKTQNKKI